MWYREAAKLRDDCTLNTVSLILCNARQRPCRHTKEHFWAFATGSTSPLKWGYIFHTSLLSCNPHKFEIGEHAISIVGIVIVSVTAGIDTTEIVAVVLIDRAATYRDTP